MYALKISCWKKRREVMGIFLRRQTVRRKTAATYSGGSGGSDGSGAVGVSVRCAASLNLRVFPRLMDCLYRLPTG